MGAASIVVVTLGLVVSGAPGSALDKCRALDKEFDTKNMPKPCQAAADDTTLPIPDRVEALRRLAFAHILNGDDALAEPAFLKMLVFAPATELPADAGPRFREVFAGVKKRFDDDGKVGVTFRPPIVEDGPVEVQVDVADKLGRVTGARILVSSPDAAKLPAPLEERLVRNELSPGNIRFVGKVPEPKPLPPEGITLQYEIVLETWDNATLASPVPLQGDIVRGGAASASASASIEGEGPPWGIIAASVGGGLLVVSAITGGVIWCTTAGPCRSQEAWVRVQIGQGP